MSKYHVYCTIDNTGERLPSVYLTTDHQGCSVAVLSITGDEGKREASAYLDAANAEVLSEGLAAFVADYERGKSEWFELLARSFAAGIAKVGAKVGGGKWFKVMEIDRMEKAHCYWDGDLPQESSDLRERLTIALAALEAK